MATIDMILTDGYAVLHGVIVSKLALHQVGAQESVCHKGARQFATFDVILDLQAHLVAGQVLLKLSGLRRVELDLERCHVEQA
jgi:hypothetical protein